jgi:hypothetical protein
MSLDLYTTRLVWNGRIGLAKRGIVTVQLQAMPAHVVQAHSLDFTPELQVATIRPRPCDSERDIEPHERASIIKFLDQLEATTKDLLIP